MVLLIHKQNKEGDLSRQILAYQRTSQEGLKSVKIKLTSMIKNRFQKMFYFYFLSVQSFYSKILFKRNKDEVDV